MHVAVAIRNRHMIELMLRLAHIEDSEQIIKVSIIITWNQPKRRGLTMTLELITHRYNAFTLELQALLTAA